MNHKFFRNLLAFSFFVITLLTTISTTAFAAEDEPHGEEEFKLGEMILHHVSDAHEWHFATIGHTHVTLPLPVILYSKDRSVEVFSSSKFHNEGRTYGDYKLDNHDHIVSLTGRKITDFSITKNVASLLLSAVILILVFTSIASAYSKNRGKAPRGIQSFFEPIIVTVRDDIAKNNIHGHDKHGHYKYEKYLPYLLTIFFFIWFNNLLGLLPGAANLTGNIAVTLVLAVFTLLFTLLSSNKYYWQHIFNTPGVPWWLKTVLPIMPVVELAGVFIKPISLTIRLFANITAGHIIILSLLGLIFIFQSIAVSPVIVLFSIFMNFIELLVAILQAYIFTLLSAMYIGSAVEGHEEHDDLGH